MNAEEEDNFRLRKATEFLAHCKECENRARVDLACAVEQTRAAKAKHEALFLACEARAVARKKAEFSAFIP